MLNLSFKGSAEILLIILLIAATGVGGYLIKTSQTGFLLEQDQATSSAKLVNSPDAQILIKLLAKSEANTSNLFVARLKFPTDILEVKSLKSDQDKSFITYWVEKQYDNSKGTISIIGGIPSPGFKTDPKTPALMAVITFKAKKEGQAQIDFTPDSKIYRNSDNQNILNFQRGIEITISPLKNLPR